MPMSSKTEISGNEAELRNLGLQLKAIEAMCDTVVPADMDPELLQSIRAWKADWADLKRKMSSRKAARQARDGDEVDVTINTLSSP
jgi:hypothetical protein